MFKEFNCSCPVCIACVYTDLRRGIDWLASLIMTQFMTDSFQRVRYLLSYMGDGRPELSNKR